MIRQRHADPIHVSHILRCNSRKKVGGIIKSFPGGCFSSCCLFLRRFFRFLFSCFHRSLPRLRSRSLILLLLTCKTPGNESCLRTPSPEYIIVHDGPPSDSRAKNYYVKYKDYIKNVASSEIYATWPEETLIANILAIQSITLNRVYTEWYRNKNYDFTITSSTAYDQKWISGRNIYASISQTVDSIFSNYLARPNITQPIFTQYCDGRQGSCPNWMRQWESKTLGDRGYSAIEILRYFYGNSMYIASSEEISGVPSSWPGSDLTIGSSGQKVRQLQQQLNTIAGAYPLIPKLAVDGIYGKKTAEAVKTFQQIFNLPATGVTDYPTWYKISEIYVGVSRIAELM